MALKKTCSGWRLIAVFVGQPSNKRRSHVFRQVVDSRDRVQGNCLIDLMLTMRAAGETSGDHLVDPPASAVEEIVRQHLAHQAESSPSLLYLELLRHGFCSRWDLSRLDLGRVTKIIENNHRMVDRRSARVV